MKTKIIHLIEIIIVAAVVIGGLMLGVWYLRNKGISSQITEESQKSAPKDEILVDIEGINEEVENLEALENELSGQELEEIENALSEENLSAIE